ncbi:transposable element Tcb2 transposase [Trichonephila clavipes]|nr:transposable element Tcb2 transposase [Trichonephila clavipes]
MVRGAIAYNTLSSLILIHGKMTAQWYVHDILQPYVLPFMAVLPRAIFQQDNARPNTARMSQDCLRHITTLSFSARFPDLTPIKHIWDHLVQSRRARHHSKRRRRWVGVIGNRRNGRRDIICPTALPWFGKKHGSVAKVLPVSRQRRMRQLALRGCVV